MGSSREKNEWANWIGRPGTRATDRLPQPLANPRILIRPQTLAEAFCSAGHRLGAADVAVAQIDSGATIWAHVFQNEPAYLLSELLSFKTEDVAFSFTEALDRRPQVACIQLAQLAANLQGWKKRIENDHNRLFSKQFQKLDSKSKLTQMLKDFANADVRTTLAIAEKIALKQMSITSADVMGVARATREALRASHTTLRNAVTTLKPQAQMAFDARILSGKMDPGLGLLIAELRTCAHVEAHLNELPLRHTKHYYQDIIGQEAAPASTERVLLDLGHAALPGHIPHGANLEALLSDGTVQHFATRGAVPLTPAKVCDIKLLNYQTDDKISLNTALDGITGVRAAQVSIGALNQSQPVFSSGQKQPLRMGLDIVSRMFSLAQGKRRIDLKLNMTRASNLPAVSEWITKSPPKDLAAHWSHAGHKAQKPKDVLQDQTYVDPDLRQALFSDPELILAFFGNDTSQTALHHSREIGHYAAASDKTLSLSLVYEYLSRMVKTDAQLRLILRRILTISMLENIPLPSGPYSAHIQSLIHNHKLFKNNDKSMIYAAFIKSPNDKPTDTPEDLFQSLLGEALDLTISTQEGPRKPDIVQIMPLQDSEKTSGIVVSMLFNASSPALVGQDIPDAPLLELRYAKTPRVCPVSFFERYSISSIGIDVDVTGLKTLAAFSDDAPVVTDQKFQPFGPRPKDGATFIAGSPEMARKPVTAVGVSIDWTDMPPEIGGFKAHYASYTKAAQIPNPQLSIDYLSGDGWRPVSRTLKPLFNSNGVTGKLLANWTFNGRVTGHSISAAGTVSAKEFKSRQSMRAGAIRMTLSGTGDGFNADLYPLALVKAMRPGYLPLPKKPMPKAPFVPTVAQFSLNYCASATIELMAPSAANSGDCVTQVGPFGKIEIYPNRKLRQARLFPKRLGFGELYIQIKGSHTAGPIALAFATTQSGHLRTVPTNNPIKWHYLSADGWCALPDTAFTSDTTGGLMNSGLLLLDLPADAIDHSSEMPPGGVWIAAVATRPRLDIFPELHQIKVGGVWAIRTDNTLRAQQTARSWSFSPAQKGITTIREMVIPKPARPHELQDTFTARVSERLRHRKRAVTPWDIERLLLQNFTEIWLVKCMPHLSSSHPTPAPGHLTVIVLRAPAPGTDVPHYAPHLFDVATLEKMRFFLRDHASEFAKIEVVNPTFERLQMRAKIAIKSQTEDGVMAKMLKTEIAKYLSVWTAPRSLGRFGWQLNKQMLRAHLMQLDYVKDVSDFSMLHFSGNDAARFELLDTAQNETDPRGQHGPILRPRFPWSLPLSAADHILKLVDTLTDESPTPAGIGSLGVGDMLIVGQRTLT
ncbi:MAG: hypothetical protein OSA51_05005 [Octadecabacter sp.]|nr:hypothetical protein [Octadecabacter sp.]